MTHRSLTLPRFGLALALGLGVGLGLAACKRTVGTFALDPLDTAGMASCNAHGRQNRDCNACNAGETAACIRIATHYERRFDVLRSDRDNRQSAVFYGRACEQGHDSACVVIGDYYATLRGLDHYTREMALKLRDRACAVVGDTCASNDALACRVAGRCQAELWPRRKAPQDLAAAQAAFSRGCDLGDAISCARLGWLYDSQGFSAASQAQSLAAYQRACDGELVEGCMGVAAHQFYGLGTEPAPAKARALAQGWCERGAPQACQAVQGYHIPLWSVVRPSPDDAPLPGPDAKSVAQLELRAAWTSGVGRTGFCIANDGRAERVETLDSTGDPALDELLRATVSAWSLPRPPQTTAPMCLVHEQRFVMTFRSGFSRPFYVVDQTWDDARRMVAILDFDPQRPSR